MPTTQKPVVALDIDGVLNAGGAASYLGPGWEDHPLEIPAADLPDSPFIGDGGEHDLTFTATINPSVHGPWITRLREQADVVWASTWEQAANLYLAPLLGIASLPVGISVKRQKPRFGDAINAHTTSWKAHALERAFAGRPLVWLDDYPRKTWERDGAPTLVIEVDPQFGLTAEHMAKVDAFVEEYS